MLFVCFKELHFSNGKNSESSSSHLTNSKSIKEKDNYTHFYMKHKEKFVKNNNTT